jgi:hypothetical protein
MTSAAPRAAQQISVALSREELFVLMRLLGARAIPGFDTGWLNIGPDGQPASAMLPALEAAANGLLARGLLTASEPGADQSGLAMPSPLIALVGTSYLSEMNVLLSLRVGESVRQAYLHEFRDLGVAHTTPLPGLHQFSALDGRRGIMGAIENVLTLHTQTAPQVPPGIVADIILERARDAARLGQGDAAVQHLVGGGLAAPTAQALASVIARSTALVAVTVARRGQPNATLGAVVATNECFTLVQEGPQSRNLVVQPASADGIRQWVAARMGQPASVSA